MRTSGVVLALAGSLLVTLVALAAADGPRHYPDQEETPSFAGNAAHLPVGPGVDPVEAIDAARSMPGVRWALDRCARRGYVRHPERDAAVSFSSPPITAVVLALEKPGLVDPPGLVGAPVVQVATALDYAGNPSTQVSGGLVFFDFTDGSMRPAEDVPGFATDASFDARPAGGGSPRAYVTDRVVQCFHDYLMCAGVGNAGCVVSSLLPPRGWWSVAGATVCVATNTSRCVYSFAKCWATD